MGVRSKIKKIVTSWEIVYTVLAAFHLIMQTVHIVHIFIP